MADQHVHKNRGMDEDAHRRRNRIALLAIALPILAGFVIAGIVYLAGGEETEVTTPKGEERIERHLVEAATPAEAGTPAPRVRLTEAGSGKAFDGASLGSEPYAVVFITSRCEEFGGFLYRVAAELGPGEGAVLAISADPGVDTPAAAAKFLSHNHIKPGGAVHFLIGSEDELRGDWNAWGFDGPTADCAESIPAHLVSGAGKNTGLLDVEPDSPADLLTTPLRGMAK
jgi:cytochrome oxidase Cu insertion factor (SCO1/SenC/PrrC family)